jgi:hypothetical protein
MPAGGLFTVAEMSPTDAAANQKILRSAPGTGSAFNLPPFNPHCGVKALRAG